MKIYIKSKISIILFFMIVGCESGNISTIKEYKNGIIDAVLQKEIHNATVSDIYLVRLRCNNKQEEILKASKVDNIYIKWEKRFLVIKIKADRIHSFKNYFWCDETKRMVRIKLISD